MTLHVGQEPMRIIFYSFQAVILALIGGASVHDLKVDIVADLNKPLPVESACADTVVCLSVLEHLCEPQTLLNEAYRIMKPVAVMVMQVPWQWWIHEAPYDFFRYTPYGLKYMFEKAGFQNIEVEPSTGFFSMWFVKMNYFSLRLIKGPRLFRGIKKAIFLPFWYIGQTISPTLDKLDKNWAAESQGYFVVAKKINSNP